jgi:hypothetical protein
MLILPDSDIRILLQKTADPKSSKERKPSRANVTRSPVVRASWRYWR